MKKVTLEITQEDIERSKKRRQEENISDCCVVSTAAQRQFKDEKICSAYGDIFDGQGDLLYKGDRDLYRYMHDFDNAVYSRIVPTTFELIQYRKTK